MISIKLRILLCVVLFVPVGLGQPVPGRSGTQRSGTSPLSEQTRTYSVKLISSGTYTDSVYKESFTLSGSWPRLTIKITDALGMMIETPVKAAGNLEGVWEYNSSAPPDNCKGKAPFSAKAAAQLGGWHSTQDEKMSHVMFEVMAEDIAQPAVPCPNTTFPNLWTRGSLTNVNSDGLEVRSHTQGGGDFSRRGGPGLFFPLANLRDGKGFTVKGSGTSGDSYHTYVWSVEIVFSSGTTTPPPPPTEPPSQQDCSVILKSRCDDLRKATWDLDNVLKNLNRLRSSDVVAKVNEIQKLIDDVKRACDAPDDLTELAAIKRALEEWKSKHRDVAPRLLQSQTEGRAIWKRLYDVADKICKRCCGGIGPVP